MVIRAAIMAMKFKIIRIICRKYEPLLGRKAYDQSTRAFQVEIYCDKYAIEGVFQKSLQQYEVCHH